METNYQKFVAKRRAWLDAYNAASPEEKERMMAEKKANAKKEAEEREKEIYNDRKARFMQRADNQIKIYELLIRANRTAMDVIKSFDGKVLNNRLTKAVETEIKKIHPRLFAELTISYKHDVSNNEGRLKISLYDYDYNSLDNDSSLYITLSPFDDGNRVVWAETESRKENEEHRQDWIADWKHCKKSYDNSYKQAMKIYEMIEKYNKSVNFNMRCYFKEIHIISNAFYV